MEVRDHPEVHAEIEKAKRWVRESRQLTDSIAFVSTVRRRIASALFLISMEHQVGILALMDIQMVASAKALMRSQLDAFLRGVWFLEKATEEQVRSFSDRPYTKNVPPVSYKVLVDEVETVERYGGGSFSRLERSINMLHDFTHGGKVAISAYVTRDEIRGRFLPWDIVSCLRSSAMLGWLASDEIAGISGTEGLSGRLEQVYCDIYGTEHELLGRV